MSDQVLYWKNPSREDTSAIVDLVEHFVARGMFRVYGRSDRFHLGRIFSMDIWRTREDRLLARFSSRCGEVEDESWEITGMPNARDLPGSPFDEGWVPNCLRYAYDNWVISNLS